MKRRRSKAMGDEEEFVRIEDAIRRRLDQKVNLIGVILEYGVSRKSKGTDYFIGLRIIDQSHHAPPGLALNVFEASVENLPQVFSCGDIIQLSNVTMKKHGQHIYALFNKNFSSFALYQGKYGNDFLPYQLSHNYYSTCNKFVDALRKWLFHFRLHVGMDGFVSLAELKPGLCVDLVCKILHVCEVSKDKWMAFVWDGSDIPPLTIETRLDDEEEFTRPLLFESSLLPRDVICTFPTVGTILRVTEGGGNGDLRLLTAGKWVKFLNISPELDAGLWHGVLMPFTKVIYIPDEDTIVSQRQRSYDKRASTKWGRMPLSSYDWPSRVTETDHEGVPFVTLMDVLTHSENLYSQPTLIGVSQCTNVKFLLLEAVAKFKCVTRVAAICPWQAENFRCPKGVYRFRLTLEDPTARIHAFVYGEDGEKFMEGYPSIDVLNKKRNKLIGISECVDEKEVKNAPRNPPWVQFCIKSYYLDESDVWGSRTFRIFDTKLVG